ncbi:MAG TPA: hypothetical protein VG245_10860 [Candidatus Dormibacteraeota bacterium]|jgi:hypothetical protein|nr:hypothetical protein [Candidatus Dormibacteraeota bacterium]
MAACGEGTYSAPSGPFASPGPSAPAAVAARGCGAGSTPGPADVQFAQTAVIRQGTELRRVADDLSGAVPGGDLAGDTQLALHDAQALRDLFAASNLCAAVRAPLAAKAATLAGADTDLVAAGHSGGDVTAALAKAQAAYQDLVAALGR